MVAPLGCLAIMAKILVLQPLLHGMDNGTCRYFCPLNFLGRRYSSPPLYASVEMAPECMAHNKGWQVPP